MKILKTILKLLSIYIILILPLNVMAAGIDHFELILNPSDKANIGETLDITIKAVDKNNNIVKGYVGSILVFSESDPEAGFPTVLKDNSYTFTPGDQGEVKFENAVVFNNAGLQNISVYDLNDDTILGLVEINIHKIIVEKNVVINILSPESGLTIGDNKIKISGKSTKNHKIRIIINGSGNIDTTTDSNGIFEIEANNLKKGENSIKAKILNADDLVIGSSDIVNIKVDSTKPSLKSLKVTPNEKVEPEGKINIEVIATIGLKEVDVIINDVILPLNKDNGTGIYTGALIAPKDSGDYSVDVVLKDNIGHEIKELASGNINVKKVELKSAVTDILDQALKDVNKKTIVSESLKNLTITGIKVVELKTKSVLSWDPIDGAKSYNVYQKTSSGNLELISTTNTPRFEVAANVNKVENYIFLVKASAETSSGILYSGDLSRAIKIKTGPEIYILLLISILLGSFVFLVKRKA